MHTLEISDLDFDRNIMATSIQGGATASTGVITAPGVGLAGATAKANGDNTLALTRTATTARSNPYAAAGAGAAGAAAGSASVKGTKATVKVAKSVSAGVTVGLV
jgi:hypothetical protein